VSEDPYLYPDSDVLRNRLGIRDKTHLEYVERELVTQRLTEGAPTGRFDLAHLRAIHHHLFQDLYNWAGQIRRVEIAKEGNQFQFRRFIETGMVDVHQRLQAAEFLRGLNSQDFAAAAGQILGDVNYVHPFREGNGRVQAEYLRQLGAQAGQTIDLTQLDGERWIAASRAAHHGDYSLLAAEILRATRPDPAGPDSR
jgi:cell filamentation protein